jgi:hypothetical protein
MELRKNILSAVLLAVGFVLHQIVPPFFGVTFDIQLAMLFVVIAINMDIKNTVITSLASGVITALTTKFPGGQVPNIIDKAITGLAVYFLLVMLKKVFSKQISLIIAGLAGTIISGSIFLTAALLITQKLPAPFSFLFLTVVLPTAAANTVITPALFGLVDFSKKAARFEISK